MRSTSSSIATRAASALAASTRPYAFRGMSDAAYPLTTSLSPRGGDSGCMEQHLLFDFRKYAHCGD